MALDLGALLTLGLLAAGIHWIAGRSSIMKWFWSAAWLPKSLGALLACAACSGFWLGVGLGVAGVHPIMPLGDWTLGVLCSGLLGVVVTPVIEGVLLWGLSATKIA